MGFDVFLVRYQAVNIDVDDVITLKEDFEIENGNVYIDYTEFKEWLKENKNKISEATANTILKLIEEENKRYSYIEGIELCLN